MGLIGLARRMSKQQLSITMCAKAFLHRPHDVRELLNGGHSAELAESAL